MKKQVLTSHFIRLTISLPETIVHTAIPTVIRNTDRYLETGYRLRKITMPIIILAIREPWNVDKKGD